jgi:ribosome recycling factor
MREQVQAVFEEGRGAICVKPFKADGRKVEIGETYRPLKKDRGVVLANLVEHGFLVTPEAWERSKRYRAVKKHKAEVQAKYNELQRSRRDHQEAAAEIASIQARLEGLENKARSAQKRIQGLEDEIIEMMEGAEVLAE